MVRLTPFTAGWLPAVRPWFEHPEVRRRLGGPEWPARCLTLAGTGWGETFRGRTVLRDHSWLALNAAGEPVAQIGGEVYDRWCRHHPNAEPDRPEAGPAMGLAYVVDPRRWRQGFGRDTLQAVTEAPEVAGVVLFAAGIEPDNVASARCAAAAGFAPDDPHPDWENMVHHVLRRPPLTTGPAPDPPRS